MGIKNTAKTKAKKLFQVLDGGGKDQMAPGPGSQRMTGLKYKERAAQSGEGEMMVTMVAMAITMMSTTRTMMVNSPFLGPCIRLLVQRFGTLNLSAKEI